MPFQLVVVDGPDKGRTVELKPGETLVIGRGTDCSLQLNDPHASRNHCKISLNGKTAELTDAGSRYGTLVRGQKVQSCALHADDVFKVGETEIRFADTKHEAARTLPPGQKAAAKPQTGAKLRELVGQRLADRYDVESVIAEGRSGVVFKAREPEADRTVAIKVLWPELAQQEDEVQRFIRTIKTVLPLKHPNIVRLYRAGKNGPYCWMAMEFVEGESVAKVIERIGVGGMLDWQQAFHIALHIARALELAAENKIVHRNITPHNLLIGTKDNVVKLGDLMLAKALEGSLAATITKPGEILGELPYLSPEQTVGDQGVDARSDIYNLGATVYRLVAGRVPVEGKNPAEIIVKIQTESPPPPTKFQLSIPPLFEGVILKMIAKKPEDRFQTPAALLKDLNRVAKYQGIGE